ncbi:hypothetical protein ACFXGI_29425 [Streptomyces sp. NPDC059355]|uniref:hypothetical protein n=1 Tax=Streptomyces sp. NPDC059355 TaxID=3346811 RepID=UPI0036A0DB7F
MARVRVRQFPYGIQRAHHPGQVPAVRREAPGGGDPGGGGGVLARGDADDQQALAAQQVGEVVVVRAARGEEVGGEVQPAAGQQAGRRAGLGVLSFHRSSPRGR